jgi:thioesterase domain-containing protein/acyl carrier protein
VVPVAGNAVLATSEPEGGRRLELGEQKLCRADLALSTQYQEPRSTAERQVAAIWQEVFGIDVVGVSDDFFDLGGDSFTATTLAAEIEATFGRRFTPADIITLSTVAQQAEVLAKTQSAGPELPSCLILGRAGGPKAPLFMVHGGKGFAFFKPVFLDIVGEDRSVYLFQAPGLDSRAPLEAAEEDRTVEETARLYAKALRLVQPKGPYHLAAICAGSFIALEICRELEQAGEIVARLILLDPTPAPPREKPQAANKKSAKGSSGFGGWLRGLLNNEDDDESLEHLAPGEMTGKKTKLQREKVKQRVEQMDDIPQEQRSFTEERMFKVSQQFRAALYRHVPRPYPGKAVLLVCSSREQNVISEGAFWPTHLGGMRHVVIGDTHSDIFGPNLAETARFVRDALN